MTRAGLYNGLITYKIGVTRLSAGSHCEIATLRSQ